MGYNLWLGKVDDIKDYYSRRAGSRALDGQIMLDDKGDEESLSFVINGVRKTELTLDEIDSFFCGFRDLTDLRRYLNLFEEYEDIADKDGRLIIASRYGKIDKYEIVYDNPFLQRCAMAIRNKRKNNEPEYLDRTEELRLFVERFAQYALDGHARTSMIQSKLFPPKVKENLNFYAMNTISRDEDGAKERFDRLFANLCNYKTLRGAVIWEREFLKEHKNFLVDEEDLDIVEVYEQMAEEESLRTTPLETEMLTEIDSMRDEEGNIDFDRVFSQIDNDDIYAHSKRDLQALGLLPRDDYEADTNKGSRRK